MENEESNNYIEAYKELKNFREGKKFYEGKDAKKLKLYKNLFFGSSVTLITGYVALLSCSFGPANPMIFEMMKKGALLIPASISFGVGYYLADKVKNKKSFEEKYPNVDIDISDEKLELIINNTKEESFKEIKEISNVNNDEFNNMNNESKLNDLSRRINNLKKLKAFYETQQLKENFENNKEKVLTK